MGIRKANGHSHLTVGDSFPPFPYQTRANLLAGHPLSCRGVYVLERRIATAG